MQHATDETVLGDFNDAVLEADGVRTRFFMRDGRYWVSTEGPDGAAAEFEVAFTPLAWSPCSSTWCDFPMGASRRCARAGTRARQKQAANAGFTNIRTSTIAADDELHWTGPQQNWNYMCADCHSTNVDKGYDPATAALQPPGRTSTSAAKPATARASSTWPGRRKSAERRAEDTATRA